MNRTPVADWQQLSALYEAADALDPVALDAWLVRLRAQAHPLLKQLEQMLAARAEVQHNGFLGALPPLNAPPPGPLVAEWAEGGRIGPYRLVRHLGEGGMAEVWMAQRDDGAFQRTVAIKLLFRNAGSSERDSFAQRFARERDILASLDHPHIAGLHDAGVTPTGQPWLALEYVEGETLTRWCDTQRLGIEARVRLFRQVLMAVQHAHANLVIHRDLKPGNILVTAQGEVRLLDFGIAKLMEPEGGPQAESELTRLAGRPMTPQYAAPEQLLGQPLTTACDVYALGVVLYELLCGERPYELKLDSAAQLEQSILDVEPRSPSRRTVTEAAVQARGTTSVALHKTLASDLDAIVLRALAKQPAQRYSSAEAFRADLDHWLAGEPVEARVPSAAYRLRKFALRHRLAVALSAGAVLSLIGITAVAVVMGLQAREDSARAGAARDFMLGLFKRADQEKARGADITARELLETGRKDVLTRMAAQPRLQAELLQGIGNIQKDMGEHVGASSTYADAAQLYDRLGMPREAALARTAQANVLMRTGDVALASTVLRQARDMPDRPRSDAELNARMSEVDGWIAYLQGDAQRAKPLFLHSYEQALLAFGPNHTKTMDALQGQMYVEQDLHNFDAALRLMEQLESTALRTNGVGATELAEISVERADLLRVAGHYAELREEVTAAHAKCTSDLGPNHVGCLALLLRKVNVMLKLGMVDSASAYRPTLEAIVANRKAPLDAADALLSLLKLDSATASPIDETSAVKRLKSLVESNAESTLSPDWKKRAMLALAESSLRAGVPADADRWMQLAASGQRQDEGSASLSTPRIYAKALHGISLLQQGRTSDALSSLMSARDDASKLLGGEHPTTFLYGLNVAIALEALGQPKEALALAQVADKALRRAMGSDAPTYLRATEFRIRLQKEATDEASVTRDFGRAQGSSGKQAFTDFFL
jgi:eukaryotic-like serine/threonine-protein kinase